MKALLSTALILALAGCSAAEQPRREKGERAAAQDGNASDVAPLSVPESYEVFPAEVRAEIYRWDLLNQKCSGGFRSKRDGDCDEADKLSRALLAKGWCYGGAEEPASAHWVLCAQDYPGGEGWIAGPAEALPKP